ncbi:MAG: hypothetical protein R3C30_00165 [Hyphomonadaceae bacterium]
MARGLWRTWIEQDGVDKWSARIEVRRGEWMDVEQANYEAAGHTPAFWELPMKEDYMEVARRQLEPVKFQMNRLDLQIMPAVIVFLMIVGGIMATFATIWFFVLSH